MATVFEIRDKYRAIDLRQIAEEIVKEDEDQLLDLNRLQLEEGLDSDGKYIAPEYASDRYAFYKAQAGSRAPYRTPNLKDTGAFYDRMYIDSDKFTISSSVPYAKELENKYGTNIYGISKQDLQLYAETSFNNKLRNRILNLL